MARSACPLLWGYLGLLVIWWNPYVSENSLNSWEAYWGLLSLWRIQWSRKYSFHGSDNSWWGDKQKLDFDWRHWARQLPDLPLDTDLWIKSEGQPLQGRVVSDVTRPHSYVVEVPFGQVQCNRKHLSVIPQDPSEPDTGETPPDKLPSRIMTRTQLGLPSFPGLKGKMWCRLYLVPCCNVVWFRIIKVASYLCYFISFVCWVASKIFAEQYSMQLLSV